MSSYLESVLNSRKKLPSQVRESLETISNLDRVGTHLSEAIDHSVVTLEKAEGITDTQKSQLELMCEAMETITSNKEKIARCNYDVRLSSLLLLLSNCYHLHNDTSVLTLLSVPVLSLCINLYLFPTLQSLHFTLL